VGTVACLALSKGPSNGPATEALLKEDKYGAETEDTAEASVSGGFGGGGGGASAVAKTSGLDEKPTAPLETARRGRGACLDSDGGGIWGLRGERLSLGVGFVDSAREKNKSHAVYEIYSIPSLPPLSSLTTRAYPTHARPLHPAAFVPYGIVLVRVRGRSFETGALTPASTPLMPPRQM